jgi:carbon monoxide dehydrogenase subunit G
MTVRVGVTIDAPPDAVWAAVEPIERHVDWMTDAVSITFTGPSTRGVGTTFDCLTKVGPFHTVDHMRITEWEPALLMGIRHEGLVTGAGRFTLEPVAGERTSFTWTEDLRFPWWMGARVGARLAAPAFRRIWNGNLTRLKHLVETRCTS